MKILGLSGGSVNGNSETLLKIAVQAAKGASPEGTKIDLVRIPEISIPKHFQEEDVRFGRGVIEQSDQDVSVPDDRPFVLNLIMEADVILFSCPIYSRVIPGIVKHFQDKTMGPFQDTTHVRFQLKMQPQTYDRKNDLLFKPRVSGLIAVGGANGTDWTPFGLPIMHQMLFSMGVKVVSQFQAHGCGLPGSALLNQSAIQQAQELGKAVVSQAGKPDAEFLGDHNGACPVCHLDMIVMRNANNIECATCGAKGKLQVTAEESGQAIIKAVFDEEGKKTSVLRESGREIHLQEIIETAKALKPQLSSVEEEREKLRGLDDEWLAKPPTKEQ